jgi:mRNA interferase HigB
MHVITRKRLLAFGRAYPDAVTPLDVWYRLMRKARFTNSAELKATFGSADPLGQGLVVFNIGGNKYRLIVYVRYATRTTMGRVWVRHVLTHAEYNRWSDEHRKQRT